MAGIDPTAPTPLELAFGFTFGALPTAVSPDPGADTVTARAAVDEALLTALRRPPCVMSFSGGRDSSALLALAVDVARRHGLDPPVAATNRFAGAAAADETAWQAEVLEHIGDVEHVVLDFTDELGLIGPYAQDFLLAHGARWPMNTHMHAAIADLARGGSLVTGFGGDEVLGSSQRFHLAQVLARRRRPRRGDVPIIGLAASPRAVRRLVHVRRARATASALPWLTPEAVSEISRLVAEEESRPSTSWDRQLLEVFARSRYLQLCLDSFRRLGADRDAQVVHPFVTPAVLAAFAREGGRGGLGSRAEALRRLLGDLLPDTVMRRQSKAVFDSPLWTAACTEFAASWSGGGFDPALVDAEALRADWLSRSGSVRAFGLLQAAWLHDHQL